MDQSGTARGGGMARGQAPLATHGILRLPEARIQADSSERGWTNVFASVQTERPYAESFVSVPSHLIVLHLDGYVRVERWLAGKHEGRMIAPGGTFIMPGGIDFRVQLGGGLSTVHFYLHQHILREVARDMLPGDPERFELSPRFGESDPLLERIILSVRDEMLDPDGAGPAYIDHLARAAAARLIKTATRGQMCRRETQACGSKSTFVRAVEYLRAHLHRSITLEELAGCVDLSVSQLTSLFKKVAHQPPHRFIMGLRVERARGLLSEGSLPLAEVALACGFSHQEHMTRIFKRETSLTPAVYRRETR